MKLIAFVLLAFMLAMVAGPLYIPPEWVKDRSAREDYDFVNNRAWKFGRGEFPAEEWCRNVVMGTCVYVPGYGLHITELISYVPHSR